MPGKPGNPNWVKGGPSPNPGGAVDRHPRTSSELDVRALAQVWTKPAITTAANIMMNKRNAPAVRLAAADLLLKRGHGMPVTINANTNTDLPAPTNFGEMSDQQILESAAKLEQIMGKVSPALLAQVAAAEAQKKTPDDVHDVRSYHPPPAQRSEPEDRPQR